MTSLYEMLAEMKDRLSDAGLKDAGFEAKALLTGLLDFATLDIVSKHDLVLSEDQVNLARAAIDQRIDGKPVYRILGWREFYGLKLSLSEDTLEPRPDTEILVDVILPFANGMMEEKNSCEILDLGTGSGAIALALLANCPLANALGVDQSEDALATAEKNAESLGLGARFNVLKSDWLSDVRGLFDIVVSNPPYIATSEIERLSGEVRYHDPKPALDGGDDGLDAYRVLARDVKNVLKRNGVLGLEIGFDQADSVTRLFENAGYVFKGKHCDLSGNDRVLLFAPPTGQ